MSFDLQAAEVKEPEAPAVEAATGAGDGGDKTAAAGAGEKEAENEDSLNLEIGEEDEKLLHDASKCRKNLRLSHT